jgi:hypothetical protein
MKKGKNLFGVKLLLRGSFFSFFASYCATVFDDANVHRIPFTA